MSSEGTPNQPDKRPVKVKPQPRRIPRPTGRDINEYKDVETWHFRRWAWEFLRRNPEFKIVCKQFEASPPSPEVRQEALKTFGLRTWISYRMGYNYKRPPSFVDAVRLRVVRNLPPDNIEGASTDIQTNEVAIVFRPFEKLAGFSSLKWQLKQAERLLGSEVAKVERQNGKTSTPYDTHRELLPLIRYLDLQVSGSHIDAAEILFPEKIKALEQEQGGLPLDLDIKRELVAQIAKDAAKKCQSGYRELALRYSIELLRAKKKPISGRGDDWNPDKSGEKPE